VIHSSHVLIMLFNNLDLNLIVDAVPKQVRISRDLYRALTELVEQLVQLYAVIMLVLRHFWFRSQLTTFLSDSVVIAGITGNLTISV